MRIHIPIGKRAAAARRRAYQILAHVAAASVCVELAVRAATRLHG